MNTVHELISSIADKITLPDVYQRIRGLIEEPDAKIDDFVAVINLDPALATRIIKMANNRFFGYSRNINTVKQAISLIGVIQLHDLLLSSLVIRAFSGIPADIVNQVAFWRSCAYCGITAKLLAKKCKLPASERFFVLGLLHEIGHLVMYAKIPEQIQDILYTFEQSNKPLFILEREILGFDYGQVGREIMHLWHLPNIYCNIASGHMEPEKPENNQIEIKIVSLARSITLANEISPEQPVYALVNKSSHLLSNKLTGKDLDTIETETKLYIDDVLDCLWPFARKTTKENALT